MVGALVPGRVVERYRVEERLGEGGTAVVWRVRHVHLGTEHALKVMTLLGAQAGPRLLLEGRVQAGLRHPNIVAVTDVLEIDGAYGLLMEYVPPPSLGTWLQRHGPPPVDVAEALFRGIVEGVRHAHVHGLVHRDLKPANVLLARDPARPEGFVPKVADFGLARLLDPWLDGEEGQRHTRSGLAMGTPQYMAPEQFRDAKSVDRRADLFSLGCILHELLGGVPAFAWTDMIGVYEAVLAGRWAPLPDGVPARLRDAVAGCLVADRDARIPDCGTLLAVLDGATHGATLVPRTAGRAPLAPRAPDGTATLVDRDAPTAAAPTLALPHASTLALPTLTLDEAPAPSPSAPLADPIVPVRSGGSRTRALVAIGGLAVAGLAAALWLGA
ncbi:MAG: serine/threonine-protein kinase, partial [Myxococcota bacterium]